MSRAVTRIERNGLAEVGNCALRIAFGDIRDTAITPGVGQKRAEFDGFVEFGDRQVKLPTMSEGKTVFVVVLGGERGLRLSRAGCERQRDRRRRDYCSDDLTAEHMFSSFCRVFSSFGANLLRPCILMCESRQKTVTALKIFLACANESVPRAVASEAFSAAGGSERGF